MEMEYKRYKYRLHDLSEEQIRLIHSYIDYRRFCYNWALEYWNKRRENGEGDPSYYDITVAFTEFRNRPENKWLLDFDLGTGRIAFRALRNGFKKYFQHTNRRPKFHKKKYSKKAFGVRGDRISFSGEGNRYLGLPGFGTRYNKLRIDCKKHSIPVGKNIKYYYPTISYDGLHYWLSLSVGVYTPITVEAQGEPLAVDVGIHPTAVLNDGTRYESVNSHREYILANRLSKLQKAVGRDNSRRVKQAAHTRVKYDDIPKSKNQIKRERKLRKTYQDLSNLYDNHYHQVSRDIANRDPKYIVLETLKVRSFGKRFNNKRYPSYISLYKFSQYIEYKCREKGCEIIRAENGFKSSQICSRCGNEYNVERRKIYTCPTCGLVIDRDYNAAFNLMAYGERCKQSTDCG